ncbi:DUF6069 family protein [Streptomyces albogriseolus]|uniref:DUF6069 family protein n=1 Tax=Streptomyces albogriseolus TaxID=1887 RepID=UPI0033A5F682
MAVVALLASLAGRSLLAALERFGVRRARAVRTGMAVAVLAVSLLPSTGDGMDGGTRLHARSPAPGGGGGADPGTPAGPAPGPARKRAHS